MLALPDKHSKVARNFSVVVPSSKVGYVSYSISLVKMYEESNLQQSTVTSCLFVDICYGLLEVDHLYSPLKIRCSKVMKRTGR